MAAVRPAATKAQAAKIEEEVVEDDQQLLGGRRKASAQGGRSATAAIHERLGLGQQYPLAAQFDLGDFGRGVGLVPPQVTKDTLLWLERFIWAMNAAFFLRAPDQPLPKMSA